MYGKILLFVTLPNHIYHLLQYFFWNHDELQFLRNLLAKRLPTTTVHQCDHMGSTGSVDEYQQTQSQKMNKQVQSPPESDQCGSWEWWGGQALDTPKRQCFQTRHNLGVGCFRCDHYGGLVDEPSTSSSCSRGTIVETTSGCLKLAGCKACFSTSSETTCVLSRWEELSGATPAAFVARIREGPVNLHFPAMHCVEKLSLNLLFTGVLVALCVLLPRLTLLLSVAWVYPSYRVWKKHFWHRVDRKDPRSPSWLFRCLWQVLRRWNPTWD